MSDGHNEPDPTEEPQAPQFDAFAADMLQSLEQLEEHPADTMMFYFVNRAIQFEENTPGWLSGVLCKNFLSKDFSLFSPSVAFIRNSNLLFSHSFFFYTSNFI